MQQEDDERWGAKTRWRRDERTRGQSDDRQLNNQLARQDDKRAARQDDECSQVYNSTYCSVKCLNDCCLILSPFNRGGVMISRPVTMLLHLNFSGRIEMQNAKLNEVTLQRMLWRHPMYAHV